MLTMGQVTDAWIGIDRWLARHAPASLALLAPPADPAEIAAAEDRLGLTFPADLVESLLRHNGQTEWAKMFPGRPPLSVAEIVEHYEMCMDIADEDDGFEPTEEGGEPWWDPLWIPFAQLDGDAQVVDMRPGPGQGRLGTAEHDGTGNFENAWRSLGAYLASTARVLMHGGSSSGGHDDGSPYWFPYLTDRNALTWTGLEGGDSLRPAPVGLDGEAGHPGP